MRNKHDRMMIVTIIIIITIVKSSRSTSHASDPSARYTINARIYILPFIGSAVIIIIVRSKITRKMRSHKFQVGAPCTLHGTLGNVNVLQ